jgi:NAD(P)-dependent dehydrogenase (short-subunit alcohol dehydrogenase family)
LTDGWWRFTDTDLRPNYALLSPNKWHELLRSEGFTEVATIPGQEKVSEALADHALILARGPRQQQRSWTIFADHAGMGEALAQQFIAQGDRCDLVYSGDSFAAVAEGIWQIDPARREEYERLLREIPSPSHSGGHGIVFLWPLDTPSIEAIPVADLSNAQFKAYGSALHLLQALVGSEVAEPPNLWLVTRGARHIGTESLPPSVVQAPMWGLGKVIAIEHPELHCVRVDLDPDGGMEQQVQALFAEISAGYREPQVAYRGESRSVPRLVNSSTIQRDGGATRPPVTFKEDATYLITGGFGGIGFLVAQWMAEQGARHLVLMGRSGASPDATQVLEELQKKGVQVVVARGDVSNEADVARVLAEIAQSMPPLRGVIHSAAVLDDGVLLRQNWERFAKVLGPKASGAWILHTLTKEMSLDFFVLFSAAAAIFGATGLGTYTVANTFLDTLAHYRRTLGLPGLSINWGPWEQVGMAAAVGSRREEQWAGVGMSTFSPEQALTALGQMLSQDVAQFAFLSVEWAAFAKQFPGNEHLLLAELVARQPQQTAAEQRSSGLDLRQRLEQTPPKRRYRVLQNHVREQTMKVLGLDSSQPFDVQQPLQELGLDSLMAVELRNMLGAGVELKRALPATLVFDYPTVEALTGFLAEQLLPAGSENNGAEPPVQPAPVEMQAVKEIQLSELEELSDEEAEAMLLAQLKQLQEGQ